MAMIDPPSEQLVRKAGNKYRLVSLLSKRAKELLLARPEFFLENMRIKPLEYASMEYYTSKIAEPKIAKKTDKK